jgi:hypothetical protein
VGVARDRRSGDRHVRVAYGLQLLDSNLGRHTIEPSEEVV